jgi:hypothetical protein
LIFVAISAGLGAGAHAGPYTNDLSKCLVESTSAADRAGLVKWMFSAASLHPAVSSIVTISEEQLDQANKWMADLLIRLLTQSCHEEARKALKYEGEMAIQAGFQVLGQVAGQEMFADPKVAAALSGLEKHVDQEKLKSLIQADSPEGN